MCFGRMRHRRDHTLALLLICTGRRACRAPARPAATAAAMAFAVAGVLTSRAAQEHGKRAFCGAAHPARRVGFIAAGQAVDELDATDGSLVSRILSDLPGACRWAGRGVGRLRGCGDAAARIFRRAAVAWRRILPFGPTALLRVWASASGPRSGDAAATVYDPTVQELGVRAYSPRHCLPLLNTFTNTLILHHTHRLTPADPIIRMAVTTSDRGHEYLLLFSAANEVRWGV